MREKQTRERGKVRKWEITINNKKEEMRKRETEKVKKTTKRESEDKEKGERETKR